MPHDSEESPLHHFGDHYFYEDWDLDADTWEGIVVNYVAEEPSMTRCVPAMGEISLVLATALADSDDMFLYDEFKLNFAPRDGTHHEWLGALRDRIADELWAARAVPGAVRDDVLSALAGFGIGPPSNGDRVAVERAARFGAEAPIGEIVALLGSVSLILAPSAPTEPETRAWLETVRRAVAAPAAERWPPTARHL